MPKGKRQRYNPGSRIVCDNCNGRGKIPICRTDDKNRAVKINGEYVTCSRCEGTGIVWLITENEV